MSSSPARKTLFIRVVPLCILVYLGFFGGCGGGGNAPPAPAGGGGAQLRGFDGNRAMGLLQQQVNFGPRAPNTQAHDDARDFIINQMRQFTNNVSRQDFVVNFGGTNFPLTNIIAVMPSATGMLQPKLVADKKNKKQSTISRLLIGAHWDSRPTADFEQNPADRAMPIPGANDGASGVAVLIELARFLRETPPRIPVVLIFFDGEDFGQMFYGSTFFSNNMGSFRPDAAIVIDMIGDANLRVNREANSESSNPELYQRVLQAAADLGFSSNFNGPQMNILDDHIPLIQRGVQSIDIIDFQYPDATHRFWHTLQDTPDKCSPQSLRVIGEVLLRVISGL